MVDIKRDVVVGLEGSGQLEFIIVGNGCVLTTPRWRRRSAEDLGPRRIK